jgi:polyisoprenoid-binding protein YceI
MSFIGKSVTVYKVSASSKFIVSGTSTLHDWEMVSSEAKGESAFVIKDSKVQNIKSLTVKLKSETLVSGKDKMDKNAYKALKTDENPYITFELDRVISIKDNVMQLKGEFTAGGTTKTEII